MATLKKLNIKSKSIRQNLALILSLSKIDYCNALIAGSTNKVYEKYQKAIRSVVRYICRLQKRYPTSKHMNELHILNAKHRVCYKPCNIAWKLIYMNETRMLKNITATKRNDERLRRHKDISKIDISSKIPTDITRHGFPLHQKFSLHFTKKHQKY